MACLYLCTIEDGLLVALCTTVTCAFSARLGEHIYDFSKVLSVFTPVDIDFKVWKRKGFSSKAPLKQ